jgi:hypothetical protein
MSEFAILFSSYIYFIIIIFFLPNLGLTCKEHRPSKSTFMALIPTHYPNTSIKD